MKQGERTLKQRRLGWQGPEITAVGFGAWATGGPFQFRRADHVDGWLPAATLELDEDVLREIDRVLEETGAGED